PIIVWDPDTRITRFNHAFEHLTGYTADEVIGKKLQMLFPESSFEESLKKIANTLSGEYWESVEIPILRKDGDIRIALWNSANIYAGDGKTIMATIAQGQDITESKQAEEKIRKSKIMLQAVFDGISDPLIMLDRDLSVKVLNSAAIKYYRASEFEKVIQKPCFEALRGKTTPCEGCEIPSAIQSREEKTFEQKSLIYPERLEYVTIYPLNEKDVGMGGAVIHISDITEKKKIQEQLIRADRLSSLGQLSGGIAHEIRNPLAGISLFLDILSDRNKYERTAKETEIFNEIRDEVNKIAGIIRRVVDFARPTARMTAEIDINLLIREEIKLWSVKIRKSKIDLKLSLKNEIPFIVGDPIELRQIINNLVMNSIEAMETRGTLEINTARGISSFHKDRQVAVITVKDTGPGIKPEHKASIFNPFFTTKPSGMGLGMAISHHIIERHGGTISCESEPGKETTFTIEFPAIGKESK
ncbi:MAG: PAS domain S-box protein, partial [Deltaproteobacteria bacterium]|nr:PAS domain S-box protein [Deltaproteobacteria bacterium]